jgi:hypothetical protein
VEARVAIAKVAAGDAYVETTLWSDRARAAALTLGSREHHLRALGSLIARWPR